jgi:hypothetical protein
LVVQIQPGSVEKKHCVVAGDRRDVGGGAIHNGFELLACLLELLLRQLGTELGAAAQLGRCDQHTDGVKQLRKSLVWWVLGESEDLDHSQHVLSPSHREC